MEKMFKSAVDPHSTQSLVPGRAISSQPSSLVLVKRQGCSRDDMPRATRHVETRRGGGDGRGAAQDSCGVCASSWGPTHSDSVFFFPSFLFKFTVPSSGMRSPEYTTLQVGETIAYPFHPLFNLKRRLCHMSDPFLPALRILVLLRGMPHAKILEPRRIKT
jgi:hypothetical protein